MALEVFVNKNFELYERELWEDFSAGLTSPIKDRYIKKISEVMQKEYSFLDRFVVVSGRMCPGDADSDYDAVRGAHRLRNDFSHGKPIPEQGLPTDTVQKLIRRFVKRHIEAK